MYEKSANHRYTKRVIFIRAALTRPQSFTRTGLRVITARVIICLLVQEWKEKQAQDISIFHLPAYAPHLNPIENLNNNLKRVMLKQGYSVTEDEIENKAVSVMRSIQAKKNRECSFFDNELVKYSKKKE